MTPTVTEVSQVEQQRRLIAGVERAVRDAPGQLTSADIHARLRREHTAADPFVVATICDYLVEEDRLRLAGNGTFYPGLEGPRA